MTRLARLNRLDQQLPAPTGPSPYTRYVDDPVGYARDVLGVGWWPRQEEIARALAEPPHRVLVKACHEVGKTFLAGGLVNWWYDTRDPGLVLTTAPTDTQVRDLLWKEVRAQRHPRGGFRGPRMPRLESSPRHWAHGFTARDTNAFQGRHEEHVLVIFDEAVGVDPEFWDAAETMATAWLGIFNPTDVGSRAYQEAQKPGWKVIELSALEHPNIAADLAGEPAPFPAAIRLPRLDRLLRDWCSPVAAGDVQAGDVEWPPGSGEWLRPGPLAEARLLGRWPSQAVNSVWSEAAWRLAETTILPAPTQAWPELGCDVARFGDDMTEIHARCAGISLHHESHNGWSTSQTAGRLKELARELAAWRNKTLAPKLPRCDPKKVRIKIDDSGVGGGVTDQADGYTFVPVNASWASGGEYPTVRSELWFLLALAAAKGQVSLVRLPAGIRAELRRQALAPLYSLDSKGRRVVEAKDDTKKRIKRSPDGMDAVNLAYCPAGVVPAKSNTTQRVRA